MSIWKSIKRFITGNDEGVEDVYRTQPVGDPLFERLTRECRNSNPDVHLLNREDIRGHNHSQLVNHMLSLMFSLSPSDNNLITDGWLIDALSEASSLELHRSVFYIYLDETTRSPTWEEIMKSFYERLIDLTQDRHGRVYDFVNKHFVHAWQKVHPEVTESFDPNSTLHQGYLKYFLPCHVTVYRKSFPITGRYSVFIVGRRPIHDSNEIKRREDGRAEDAETYPEADSDTTIKLAATVEAIGNRKGDHVIFNAHRFSANDAGTRLERALYIGNWLSDWELSIGSAEHDEIQCATLGSASGRITLHNLKLDKGGWHYNYRGPSDLPDWFRCRNAAKPQNARRDKNVQVYVHQHPAIHVGLRSRLNRPEFEPWITLQARVLPQQGGQLPDLMKTTDQNLRGQVQGVTLTSAIEVRKGELWLVCSTDGKIFRIVKKDGRAWQREEMKNNEEFSFSDFRYLWTLVTGNLVPSGYRGHLNITPPDNQKRDFVQYPAVDPEAGELPIADGNLFGDKAHQDNTLGRAGVVSLKSVESRDGRPAYVLLPVQNAISKFFAVQRDGHNSEWLVYDPSDRNSSLTVNRRGRATFGNKELSINGANITLVCGTSLFVIKTRPTPSVQMGSTASAGTGIDDKQERPYDTASRSSGFNPVEPRDVKARLFGTRWGRHDLIEISRSAVAIHYGLTLKDDSRFLKVYYLTSEANAGREAAFYERYRDRASSLFLKAPDEVLQNTEGKPWAQVFPRLRPLSQVIPAPTVAQAAAIGYGIATLLNAMDEDRSIDYDLHPSILCLDSGLRLVIVDFDNVYPLLGARPQPEDWAAMAGILEAGMLPCQSSSLPPEAHEFSAKDNDAERQDALKQIGSPFGSYMLAVLILELLMLSESSSSDSGGVITVSPEAIVKRAEGEDASLDAALEFETLLREMLSPVSTSRPKPADVVGRLKAIARAFADHDTQSRAEIARLLGAVPSG